MAGSKETVIGYGCEGKWVMDALAGIVSLAKKEELNNTLLSRKSYSVT